MDVVEQIKQFKEFFGLYYKANLFKTAREDIRVLIIDYADLAKFDIDLANLLIEQPEEVIKAAELAIEEFDIENIKGTKARFKNLPKTQNLMISSIRSKHLGMLLCFEGIVKSKSNVRPRITSARFECLGCGNVINVIQLESSFKEPTRCGCGRKGKFRLISKELVDGFSISLEELTEYISGGSELKRLNVFLRDDLAARNVERRIYQGARIIVNGHLLEIFKPTKTGRSTELDYYLECNHVELVEQEYTDITITEEDKTQFLKISQRNPLELLAKSAFYQLKGHKKVKEALILQMAKGVRKSIRGLTIRGDPHILLIGDTGSGKTQFLKIAQTLVPKGRFASGKGASGVGLTASVVRNEFLGGFTCEAGLLVLCNDGHAYLDEFDKTTTEDREYLHEALEEQTVSVNRANIQATLLARTTVTAAANPKFGRFDPRGDIYKQIDLPPTLVNRFDLIFPFRDIPDEDKDKEIASAILAPATERGPETEKDLLSPETIRKYIAYTQTVTPKLSPSAEKRLKEFYITIRNLKLGPSDEQEETDTVPISPRQLQSLVRFTEAHAKIRLSSLASVQDADKAIELIQFFLDEMARDETGKLNIDKLILGESAKKKQREVVWDILNTLEASYGDDPIPEKEIITSLEKEGLSEYKIREFLSKLLREGDLWEPRGTGQGYKISRG